VVRREPLPQRPAAGWSGRRDCVCRVANLAARYFIVSHVSNHRCGDCR
jgi:hypothetical protein